ncbi:hypothetical protein BsWGS_17447 [Bradybaena similaris]
MTISGQNTHPGDDLTLVLTSVYIPLSLVVLCCLFVVYLVNRYWMNRGRINGPQNSKVYGKMKIITIKPRVQCKVLKLFDFASKTRKNNSSKTRRPKVNSTSLQQDRKETTCPSNLLRNCFLNLIFWFALVLICLIFLAEIAHLECTF